MELVEATVELVRFDDQEIALAQPRARAQRWYNPADQSGGVESGLRENPGQHRRRGRFTSRAGNREGALRRGKPADHLGVLDHTDSPFGGALDLGVASGTADERTTNATSPRLSAW